MELHIYTITSTRRLGALGHQVITIGEVGRASGSGGNSPGSSVCVILFIHRPAIFHGSFMPAVVDCRWCLNAADFPTRGLRGGSSVGCMSVHFAFTANHSVGKPGGLGPGMLLMQLLIISWKQGRWRLLCRLWVLFFFVAPVAACRTNNKGRLLRAITPSVSHVHPWPCYRQPGLGTNPLPSPPCCCDSFAIGTAGTSQSVVNRPMIPPGPSSHAKEHVEIGGGMGHTCRAVPQVQSGRPFRRDSSEMGGM